MMNYQGGGLNTSELIARQPSEQLQQKIEEVVKRFQNCASFINDAFIMGKNEGFSKEDIIQMIRKQLLKLGYDPRSIRRALPQSAKDISKTRKDYLNKEQSYHISKKSDEDKLSSSQIRSNHDENHALYDNTEELQKTINTLKKELEQERNKSEDFRIQCNNAMLHYSQIRDKLNVMCNKTRVVVITKDDFPANSGVVFSSQDHVFAVEFKETKVLDITVMTRNKAYEEYLVEKSGK